MLKKLVKIDVLDKIIPLIQLLIFQSIKWRKEQQNGKAKQNDKAKRNGNATLCKFLEATQRA